ncbi:SDR family oxidoreductase [Streptomyces sp. SL13]|uniref:SDR family oxidoreductase n=1 Tax=Streptantibioticus silvisoli TaxID=2705255 RepID=A0AA90H1T3_9ACTN|nr:SDR family oxidoreductase [Streptantibioticus silvisoli]MDI5970491.1 SDR family oxidoreductase [Streptantibioticus silvisoli]
MNADGGREARQTGEGREGDVGREGREGRERTVASGEVQLAVVEFGDTARPTLVLVHGYPDSKEVWSAVAERLTDRFHVVLYDVRGHGGSSAPLPLRGGFRLEALTDDFLAVADAVSPERPVHLVGHDWGSVQGWEFATVPRAAERIASFTSISGPCLDHFGHWIADRLRRPTPRRAVQLAGQTAKSWYVYALHTPVLPELAWRGPLGRRWPRMLARAERLPADTGYPTATLPQDAAHGAWLYRDNIGPRLHHPRPAPHALVPVQLITPTGDPFLSEHLYDDLDRWVPDLTRRTLATKHWVPRTRPDQLAYWIAEFALRNDPAEHTPDSAVAPHPGKTLDAGATPAGAGIPDGVRVASSNGRTDGTDGTGNSTDGSDGEAALDIPAAPSTARRRPPRRDRHTERFGGRLVLVTGAGSGIGRATALAFARSGARVVAVDRDARSVADTARLTTERGAAGAWAETVDVSDEHAMDKLAERVTAERVTAEHGVVDILVNNAGIGMAGAFLDTTPDDWRDVLDVNLWGVIHGCRLFGQRMAERGQGGHIVNTASAAAYLPSRSMPAYCTSKAAVLMLSECLRAELAPRGIGVTAICPGIVTTGITRTARFTGTSGEEQDRLRARTTRLYRRRAYPPEKVADAILRAVARNAAVVPVTPEAVGSRLLSRLAPKALRATARIDPPL